MKNRLIQDGAATVKQSIARQLRRRSLVAFGLAVVLSPTPPAMGQDYEAFSELPENILNALETQGFLGVEYVAIVAQGKIFSFRVGPVKENELNEESIKEGEYVVPGTFGFDFAKEAPGFHVVVLSTASPGSGNDCLRGGSCKETQR
jgi:hypothetical protein